jgi:HK97 family phage major capsid protein
MSIKARMPAIILAAAAFAIPSHVLGGVHFEGDTETLLKEVNQQLGQLNGEVKQKAEDALKQSKKSGEVSAETKIAVDKLLTTQNALLETAKNLTEQLEGLDAKTLEISQAVAAGGTPGGQARMTMGQAVLATGADQIKNFVANGFGGTLKIDVGNAITSGSTSGGGLITREEEAGVISMARRQLRIRSLLSVGRTGRDLIPYARQTLRTDNTAAIAEGGTYPESAFGWTKTQAQVKKIGAHVNVSEEVVADSDLLQTEIDVDLRYGLDLEEEKQILAGDGVGENLSGLITNATAFSAAAGLPNGTRIDRLRLAILQIILADYVPTALILNPLDWAAIDLMKDGQSRFVFGNPGAQSSPRLWGKDVVESNTMSAGEWLAGDLAMAATLYDRSEAEVLISSEHDQNFIEDMLTMKARKRLALAVKRPAALVTGDFTFV